MSPASKLKLKDKKVSKEPPKVSTKHVNASSGIPASGYNPLLRTFQTIDTAPAPSASPLNVNGRFRNIDDTDDLNGSSHGTGIDYDAVSNNGSWSGESEDHKEKASQSLRLESIPGADNDKREKIRQKNERKHQRQKEKRAQELHERCTGYLMSRKLEALAQQLVAMGFPHERATMALILNEGRVEESVAWLFEAGEEDGKQVEHGLNTGGNLKIDISEEHAKMTEMEIKYKASKQEVERAIVACEGDLEKAEESLMIQKQEPSKPEETNDPPVVANGKLPVAVNQNISRLPGEPKPTLLQQKRNDTDFNYTKVPVTVGPSVNSGTRRIPLLKKLTPNLEWAKAQQISAAVERNWPSMGANPSVSYSLSSPLQGSTHLTQMDARFLAVENEVKNLQLGSVTQTVNAKPVPTSSVVSSPPGTAMGWYASDAAMANEFVPPVAVSRSCSSNGVASNLLYHQFHYQSRQPFMSNGTAMDSQGTTTPLWNRGAPILTAASSLGLFANGSSTSSSSRVDWNTGCSMSQFDYNNVDWSLDLRSLPAKPNGMWSGSSNYSFQNNNGHVHDSLFGYGLGVRSGMRPVVTNGNVPRGFEEIESTSTGGGGGSSRDWTSAFEEKDIFNLPEQFVSSPSL